MFSEKKIIDDELRHQWILYDGFIKFLIGTSS